MTNYKLPINFNGSSYISAGSLNANFNDIRFSDQSTCPTTFLNHYTENVTAGTGKMWVNLPTFPAGTKTIYMYFGSTGAPSTSNFAATFPLSYISGVTTTTMSGVQNYDWFEVSAGATINVAQSQSLTINASHIKISGIINAVGKGYTANTFSNNGNGPGGGRFSSNASAGAGGGSYGGVGGTAGYDAGDIPGTGGNAYGTSAGTDTDFGSAGGSSSNTLGGNGGGAVILNAKVKATVTGTITVNGSNATTPGVSFGGGGGAGGCIFISADYIDLTGATLSAVGGNGSTCNSAANDSGGGGGGGRIKLQYGVNVSNVGLTSNVNGGVGGPYGYAAPGQNGAAGVLNSSSIAPKANYSTTALMAPIVCFALPVNLVSFKAEKSNQTSLLTWVTTNEINNHYFVIERSKDAVNFVQIGKVDAQNSVLENNYSFVDQYPLAGQNFYRLRQVDLNEEYFLSEIRNVLFTDGSSVKVFPNPTSDQLNVYVESFKKVLNAQLFNQVGQQVKEFKLKEQNSIISLDGLSSGVYFLQVNEQLIKVVKE